MTIKYPDLSDAEYHENALYGAAQDLVTALHSDGPLQMEQRLSLARLSLRWLTHEERLRYFQLERAVIIACDWRTWNDWRKPTPNPFGELSGEPLGKITRGDL